jgi:hypothetical protein
LLLVVWNLTKSAGIHFRSQRMAIDVEETCHFLSMA